MLALSCLSGWGPVKNWLFAYTETASENFQLSQRSLLILILGFLIGCCFHWWLTCCLCFMQVRALPSLNFWWVLAVHWHSAILADSGFCLVYTLNCSIFYVCMMITHQCTVNEKIHIYTSTVPFKVAFGNTTVCCVSLLFSQQGYGNWHCSLTKTSAAPH